jgi:hypothetical protein
LEASQRHAELTAGLSAAPQNQPERRDARTGAGVDGADGVVGPAFLAFVVMGIVPLLTPAKHLCSTEAPQLPKNDVESHDPETDTAARGIPPHKAWQ